MSVTKTKPTLEAIAEAIDALTATVDGIQNTVQTSKTNIDSVNAVLNAPNNGVIPTLYRIQILVEAIAAILGETAIPNKIE